MCIGLTSSCSQKHSSSSSNSNRHIFILFILLILLFSSPLSLMTSSFNSHRLFNHRLFKQHFRSPSISRSRFTSAFQSSQSASPKSAYGVASACCVIVTAQHMYCVHFFLFYCLFYNNLWWHLRPFNDPGLSGRGTAGDACDTFHFLPLRQECQPRHSSTWRSERRGLIVLSHLITFHQILFIPMFKSLLQTKKYIKSNSKKY